MQRFLAVTFFGTLLASSALVAGCGSSGGGTTTCDAPVLLKTSCAMTGCHNTMTKAAGFDMEASGLEDRLVGVAPPGGGPTGLTSMCTTATTGMNLVYLDPGSSPATGLFLRKLNASAIPCGLKMPLAPYPPLTAAQTACIQTWADGVVASHSGSDAGSGG